MTSNTTKRIVSFSVVLLLASLSACTTQGPGNGNVNDNGTDNANDNGTDNTNDNGTDNANDNGTDNANDNGTDGGIACVSGAEATVVPSRVGSCWC